MPTRTRLRGTLVIAILAFVAAGLPVPAAATLATGCEATPDNPVCYFQCPPAAVIEMVVRGPGEVDPDTGKTTSSILIVCEWHGGGAGMIGAHQMWCADEEDVLTKTVNDATNQHCTTYHATDLEGPGRCYLMAGTWATCRQVVPPPN